MKVTKLHTGTKKAGQLALGEAFVTEPGGNTYLRCDISPQLLPCAEAPAAAGLTTIHALRVSGKPPLFRVVEIARSVECFLVDAWIVESPKGQPLAGDSGDSAAEALTQILNQPRINLALEDAAIRMLEKQGLAKSDQEKLV